MFRPPFCPRRSCTMHSAPVPGFCTNHGSYTVKCRAHPVPRFRCNSCGRTFSRQTFRCDYHDHRPHLNAWLFELLASGVGLRQSARILKLSPRCTELKARKLGRHLRRLNLNLRGTMPAGTRLQLDEIETYEGRRNTRPLTVPLLIEAPSRFILWAESHTIPPSGRMSESRKQAIERERERFGRRKDRSHDVLRRTLARGKVLLEGHEQVRVDTDEKLSYPGLLRAAFGAERLVHTRTNSKLERDVSNPLFPINQSEAIARDLMGRLRRESWLVSKKRRWLDVALHVFIAYRNYCRPRFNHDRQSPAQRLGFVPGCMTPRQLLSWRQEAGMRSLHPLSRSGESVAEFGRKRCLAA